ncbi:MAG: glycosyltransferase [Alphaproteobacteria bacterium]|nr:glycosyltransferase [Alphaproteobacteria bacterium]
MPSDQNSPRKILVIIGSMNIGGCESDILRIMPQLDRTKFDVRVVAFWQRGALADSLEASGIKFYPPLNKFPIFNINFNIKLRLTPYKSHWAAKLRLKAVANMFIRMVNKTFEIIYIYNKCTLITLPFYLATHTIPKKPLEHYSSDIINIHRVVHFMKPDIIHCFLPASYHYGTICHLLTPGRKSRKLIMSRVSLGFYFQGHPILRGFETKFCHYFVDRVVGNARMIIDELQGENLPESKIRLIYNGIQVDAFKRPASAKKIAEQGEKINLSTTANLHDYKGYGDLIEALGILARENIRNWHLYAAGRDVDHGLAKYRARCQELNIAENVTFLGQINHQQIIAHLHQSQIHIHPSHHEGLPNSILEAMSAELPIIATRVGGIPELVKDGESGTLLPPHRPDELAKALKYLLQHPEIRQKMGAHGAAIAQENFTLAKAVKNFEQLYTESWQ